jgi:hypothetical protein
MSIHISAKMRKKAYQGFFIITIISLAGVPTFFKLIFNSGQSIAVVDGMTISPQEYQAAIMKRERQLSMIRSQLSKEGQISDEMLNALGVNTNSREAALDELVTEKLIDSVVQKLHIKLHGDYIAQTLRNPQVAYQLIGDTVPFEVFDMQRGGIALDRLKMFLQRQGKTIESFDAMLESKLQRALVLNLIKDAAVTSSAELQAAQMQKHASKSFTITTAAYAKFAKGEGKDQAEKRAAELIASSDAELIKKELLAGNLKVTTITLKPGKDLDKQAEQLKKDGISVERLGRMFHKGQSFVGSTATIAYKVELYDVGSVAQDGAQKERHAAQAALEAENANQLAYDFIASLREHAKIVMNRSLLKGM